MNTFQFFLDKLIPDREKWAGRIGTIGFSIFTFAVFATMFPRFAPNIKIYLFSPYIPYFDIIGQYAYYISIPAIIIAIIIHPGEVYVDDGGETRRILNDNPNLKILSYQGINSYKYSVKDSDGLPVIVVPHARTAGALVSASLYGNPIQEMVSIGITGTNGKTY